MKKISQIQRKYRRKKRHLTTNIMDRIIFRALRKNNVKVVVVTGSIGKTSARVAISTVLSTKYKLHFNYENHNAARPLRLQFFAMPYPRRSHVLWRWIPIFWKMRFIANNYPYDAVVLELAESRYRTLKSFINKIHPDVAVITGASPVHMAYFSSIDRLVRACWLLVKPARKIFYNADFAALGKQLKKISRAKGYSLDKGEIRLDNIARTKTGYLSASLIIRDKSWPVSTQFIGQQSLYAVVAAALVADQLGLSGDVIAATIPLVMPVKGRLQMLEGKNGARILDDSYNANLKSVEAALDVLSEFDGYRVAVLGKMNELGDYSKKHHQQIGRKVAKSADELIAFGDDAIRYMAPAAIAAGMPKAKVITVPHSRAAGKLLAPRLDKDYVVLVKGSESKVFAEEATKQLLASRRDLIHRLVRQQNFWMSKKELAFKSLETEYSSNDSKVKQ